MSNELNSQIRKVQFKGYGQATVVILLFIILGYFFLPPLGKSSSVYGEVTGFKVVSNDPRFFLTVRLDSKLEVLAQSPWKNNVNYRKGERVKLLKMESLVFGFPEYQFQHYVSN